MTKEISVAVELKKYIIPVRLDKSPYADSITYDLSGIDYIDYEKEKEKISFIFSLNMTTCRKFEELIQKQTGDMKISNEENILICKR